MGDYPFRGVSLYEPLSISMAVFSGNVELYELCDVVLWDFTSVQALRQLQAWASGMNLCKNREQRIVPTTNHQAHICSQCTCVQHISGESSNPPDEILTFFSHFL